MIKELVETVRRPWCSSQYVHAATEQDAFICEHHVFLPRPVGFSCLNTVSTFLGRESEKQKFGNKKKHRKRRSGRKTMRYDFATVQYVFVTCEQPFVTSMSWWRTDDGSGVRSLPSCGKLDLCCVEFLDAVPITKIQAPNWGFSLDATLPRVALSWHCKAHFHKTTLPRSDWTYKRMYTQ